ncbi:hypothetical protein CCR75_004840 [Bremia lactucae]|uniref:Uncharacterized protein n=1 Tax=Bremia lactucae TaxID=4779 RepID=A0A976ICV0_BRELC|nr:hypothetical protein CCR75_004840 [Bremia lactucae]
MINQHEKPVVMSGVGKQQITDRGRDTNIRPMDVLVEFLFDSFLAHFESEMDRLVKHFAFSAIFR